MQRFKGLFPPIDGGSELIVTPVSHSSTRFVRFNFRLETASQSPSNFGIRIIRPQSDPITNSLSLPSEGAWSRCVHCSWKYYPVMMLDGDMGFKTAN